MKYFVTHYKPLKERKQNLLIQFKKENIEAEFIEDFVFVLLMVYNELQNIS